MVTTSAGFYAIDFIYSPFILRSMSEFSESWATDKMSRRERLRIAATQLVIRGLVPKSMMRVDMAPEPEPPYDPLAHPVIIIGEVALVEPPNE